MLHPVLRGSTGFYRVLQGSGFYEGRMTKGRLEAFSDGVIAIIITIMVLELKVPHAENGAATLADLVPLIPVFISYVLSFVFVAIYWNNHHHLLHVAGRVTGGILWANIHLLFWLSLVPFVTAWRGENHFAPLPVALYGVDIDEDRFVMEVARSLRAVSYAKGCYLGQEPIVMARDRAGFVNRSFLGVKVLEGGPLPAGTKLFRDAAEVGRVTSSLHSPRLNAPLALAYIRRGNQEPGLRLEAETTEGRRPVEVLPFPPVEFAATK